MSQGETKTIKFNDNVKLEIAGSAKGLFYFKGVTVSFNIMDEGAKDLVIIHMDEWKKTFEKNGYMFVKTPMTEIQQSQPHDSD